MIESATSLVAQLRRRVDDERASMVAFRFACTDEAATECLLNITRAGRFQTNVIGGRVAKSLDLDLTSPQLREVEQLIEYLATQPGYALTVEQDHNPRHESRDLQLVGSSSILRHAQPLQHHLFSDRDLLDLLSAATTRHNVSYTPHTVPPNEEQWVLMLAHAEALRNLAADAAKRRVMQAAATDLVAVADSLEVAYRADTKRQQRAIPVPKFDDTGTDQGDVVIGQSYRRSFRNGYYAPISAVLAPTTPELHEPTDDDVEDVKVTIRWRRNRDQVFHALEIWRDTRAEALQNRPTVYPDDRVPALTRYEVKRPFTQKLVFRSFGAHSHRDNVGWATYVEQAGQTLCAFTDQGSSGEPQYGSGGVCGPPLEPDTTYYYRAWAISTNHEATPSNIVSVHTKRLRALMLGPYPLAPRSGLAGTLVTMVGVRFHEGMQVTMGGKPVGDLTVLSDVAATFVVPVFYSPAAVNTLYDVVVISETGLVDVFAQGFRYTGAT